MHSQNYNKTAIENKIEKNVILSNYTTFKIGGPADYFVSVDSIDSFKDSIKFARKNNIPYFILGGGSNLLISDKGVRGLVIKNNLKGIKREGNLITVMSGEDLCRAVEFAAEEKLSWFEFATGIPGTVGGAVYGNAGAYGRACGDILVSAKIMDRDGQIRQVGRDYFSFDYRHSCIKETGEIILEVTFELVPADKTQIRSRMDEIMAERSSKHKIGSMGCAGSYFKNLPPPAPGERRVAAGQLLDKIGAKGMKKGGAMVFTGHANFIVNPGNATACEVLSLAEELKEKVKKEFDVELEEEVRYIDEFLTGDRKKDIDALRKENPECPGLNMRSGY